MTVVGRGNKIAIRAWRKFWTLQHTFCTSSTRHISETRKGSGQRRFLSHPNWASWSGDGAEGQETTNEGLRVRGWSGVGPTKRRDLGRILFIDLGAYFGEPGGILTNYHTNSLVRAFNARVLMLHAVRGGQQKDTR